MLVRQQREEDFVPKRLDSSWLSSASESQTLVIDLVIAYIARAKAQRTDWQGNHRLCIMNFLLFRSSGFAGVKFKHNFKRSVGLILNIKRTLNLSQVP